MQGENTRTELPCALALKSVKGLNNREIKKLLDHYTTPSKVFQGRFDEIATLIQANKHAGAVARAILTFKDFDKINRCIEKAEKLNLKFTIYGIGGYPQNLEPLPDPPIVLFYTGEIKQSDNRAVAVVGTRKTTNYGKRATTRLVEEISRAGITIISGMARGIDSEAHRAALQADGRTIAVMGTGHHTIYPPENVKLKKKIEENGAVISEYPPGYEALKRNFLERNRIIAGISLGTIVVEAPKKSGALNTASHAANYNREVFSVPGNITSSRSAGCNALIREGAKLVTCGMDVLEELNLDCNVPPLANPLKSLSPEEIKILEIMGDEGALSEIIIQKSDMPAQTITGLILQMELKGLVRKMPGNIIVPA